MKSTHIVFVFLSLLVMGGCFNIYGDPPPDDYGRYRLAAITITKDSLKNSIHVLAPHELHNPGKIYTYKNYLFIVEVLQGVHIIDNADPHNPVNRSFITVPGCMDIAVRNFSLYADNAVDLVTINITDPNSPQVTSRIENVFPTLARPTDSYYSILAEPDLTKEVVIGWKDTIITIK